jgi:hypothetical protein
MPLQRSRTWIARILQLRTWWWSRQPCKNWCDQLEFAHAHQGSLSLVLIVPHVVLPVYQLLVELGGVVTPLNFRQTKQSSGQRGGLVDVLYTSLISSCHHVKRRPWPQQHLLKPIED